MKNIRVDQGGHRKMKKITQVVTFIMIVAVLFGLGRQQVNAADNITKSTVADSETINNWHEANA